MPTTIESISQWFLDLQEPEWLLLAVVPVSLAYFYLTRRRRRHQVTFKRRAIETATVAKRLDRKGRDRGDREFWRRHLPAFMILIILLSLTPVMSQPTLTTETVEERSLITWLIDTSESMTTVDVTSQTGEEVSRFDGVIETLKLTIDQTPDNAFRQMVAFSDGDDVTTYPLARSSEELAAQIEALAAIELTRSTDSEEGLEEAVRNCVQTSELVEQYGTRINDPDQADNELAMPCVIILLSDGKCDNQPWCTSQTVEIATEAHSRGIRIHTVSWGDPNSDLGLLQLPDTEAMQAIADAGGGQHLETADTGQLINLYNEVMEQVDSGVVHQGVPMGYVWFARVIFAVAALAFWPSYLMNQAMVIRTRPRPDKD